MLKITVCDNIFLNFLVSFEFTILRYFVYGDKLHSIILFKTFLTFIFV